MKGLGLLGWIVAAGLLAAALYQQRPNGRTFEGTARVIDGDSLRVGDTEVRLFGIDAFEGRQVCTRDGSPWRCGEAAASELRTLTQGRTIACNQRGTDSYGRTVAVCSNGDADLAAALARLGLALAYREFSDDYVDEEADAQSARRGAWAGEFTAPWDARRGRNTQAAPEQGASDDTGESACRGTGVKGNISRSSDDRIYHVPGSRSYNDTVIDEPAGERWFCSEQEAVDAGWRAPRG
jgi:endonuclease YncB( thermonuclease family)